VPSAPASWNLTRLLGPKGIKAALIGAVAGLAFILLAAVVVRPMLLSMYAPALDAATANITMPEAQKAQARQLMGDALGQVFTVPMLAVNLHVPAQTLVVKASGTLSAQGASQAIAPLDMTMDLQTPVSLWNGLSILAIALAAFVSVAVAKPSSARQAVIQGAITSVPYALGLMIVAGVASIPVDLSSHTLRFMQLAAAQYGADVAQSMTFVGSATVAYSFPFIALALFALVAGIALGGIIGSFFVSYTSRRSFGDVARESSVPFFGPIAGAGVAVAVALVISLLVAMGVWTFSLKPAMVASVPQTPQEQQVKDGVMKYADGAVLMMSPSIGLYAYEMGHGGAFTTQGSGTGATAGNQSVSLWDSRIQSSLAGPGSTGPSKNPWSYLLLLMPVLPLMLGGYLSASWSRGASSRALEGAKVAIPYAVLMVGIVWITRLSVATSIVPYSAAGTGAAAMSMDLLMTVILALAWGATFGALGGWLKEQRSGNAVIGTGPLT
jgi:hypothetical protein